LEHVSHLQKAQPQLMYTSHFAKRATQATTQATHMRQSQREQMLMTEGLMPLSAAILLWV